MSSFTTITTLVALLLALATSSAFAQTAIKEYNTRPTLSYTFDVDPYTVVNAAGRTQAQGSSFGFALGAGTHSGVVSMDGSVNDRIDLNYFWDDSGANMTNTLLGGEVSFEIWASIMQTRQWTRYFDFGAGAIGQSDNLFAGLNGNSRDITFFTYNGTSGSSVTVGSSLNLYQWQHVVFTVTKNPASTTLATAATLSIYIDGVLRTTGSGYLPLVMLRPKSCLGHSNWPGDQGYRGLIDDFFVYNYSLSSEAVAAHYAVSRVAMFELVFSTDPRLNMNLNGQSATYSWLATDSNDSPANQVAHKGLVVLASNQFLNVGNDDGVSAVGTALPTIGGAGWSNADNDTTGWTFEVTVKFNALTPDACVFDFSSAAGTSHIALCFSRTGSSLQFLIGDSLTGTTARSIDVAQNLATTTWYHIVVNVQPQDVANAVARYEVFVNGRYERSTITGAWPLAVARPSALIGRARDGAFVNAIIDSLRVYDYALTVAETRNLYAAVSATLGTTVQPLYSTAPTIAHTFDEFVPWPERNGGTALDWVSSMSGRAGVISLSASSSQYVNLLTLPDRNYNVFPGFIGGRSLSFEFWIMFTQFNSWQRVLDLSAPSSIVVNNNAVYQDNIFVATLQQSNASLSATMVFAVVSGTDGYTDARVQHSNEVFLNRWYHVVLTIKQNRAVRNTSLPSAAQMQLYVNGNLDQFTNTSVPRYVSRPSSAIGQSRYAADRYLSAYIDAFYYYDYPLEIEQVRVHFNLPRPPVMELTFASTPSAMPQMNATGNYQWLSVDSASTAQGQVNHPGLLVLSAASQQYVDFTTVTNANITVGVLAPTFGTQPDTALYGSSSTFLSNQLAARIGFTLEFSFQYTAASGANAKLFSCASLASGADLIEIGFALGSRDLVLTVANSDVARSSTITLVRNMYYAKWSHVTVVMSRVRQDYATLLTVFVDGVANITTPFLFPYATPRDVCVLGRSVNAAADSYLDGMIDVFRVYDYALNTTEAVAIYNTINPMVDPAAGIAPPQNVDSASSSSSSLSGGAIAGIVIGCIVAVILVFVVFVLYKRSDKGSSSSSGASARNEQKHVELSEVREDESHESEAEETA